MRGKVNATGLIGGLKYVRAPIKYNSEYCSFSTRRSIFVDLELALACQQS